MAKSTRSYPGKPVPQGGDYLPPSGIGGPYGLGMGLGGMGGADPVTTGPGKSIKTQHMGSVIGQRGAGRSQITPGDQGSHSLGHYKKGGITGMVGGGS